jgi:hypothetical protein
MNRITEANRKRLQFLRHLYEVTGGNEYAIVNDQELGNELGFTGDETDKVVRYLEGEHLIETVTFGGNISITHWGIVEIEKALSEPDQPTQYFPPVNVIIGGEQMTVFDQRGQHVTYQYNAAGDINFGAVQNRMDVVAELEKLKAEFDRAAEAGIIDEDTVIDAKYQLNKAASQAKRPKPDKKTVLQHLEEAKALISGVVGAAGLITALIEAADKVRQFF